MTLPSLSRCSPVASLKSNKMSFPGFHSKSKRFREPWVFDDLLVAVLRRPACHCGGSVTTVCVCQSLSVLRISRRFLVDFCSRGLDSRSSEKLDVWWLIGLFCVMLQC